MPLAVNTSQREATPAHEQDQISLNDTDQLFSTARRASRITTKRSSGIGTIFLNIGETFLKHRRASAARSTTRATPTASGVSGLTASSSCQFCSNSDVQTSSQCNCRDHGGGQAEVAVGLNLAATYRQDSPHMCRPGWSEERGKWIFGRVLDPRSKVVQGWNRLFLLVCVGGAALDPLFLYLLSMQMELACLFVDKHFAVPVTVLRTLVDLLYLGHMWLQLKLAYVSKESLVLGTGQLVWDARKIAMNYLHHAGNFVFDLFVILPIPQFVFWIVIPAIISHGFRVSTLLAVILSTFCLQYIPKVLHMVLLIRRMQHVTGYIFGTALWGFALNLIAYFIAAHIAGAFWYLLTINEIEECVLARCWAMENCTNSFMGCPVVLSYGHQPLREAPQRASFAKDHFLHTQCMKNGGKYNFGIYHSAVDLATQSSWPEKLFYPLFWGLMTLSSFGNALQPTNEPVEVAFCILVITAGLILFMLLIGNIQVFLHSITARKEMMQLRMRDVEWWMRRRQLPARLRQRVRCYERQHWAATRGVDESAMVCDLPQSLRRDIKRHLCLDLVRQVPLFHEMDELVLDNVCERLTARLFIKGERVLKEGDPVMRMLFLVRGHFQNSFRLGSSSNESKYCYGQLGPGDFCGDELLPWCLQKVPVERLPPSMATWTALDSTEVFALEACDLKFVVHHFRYKFEDPRMRSTLRFYSSSWRMWAAVTIQLAWRRFKSSSSPTAATSPLVFPRPNKSHLNEPDSEAAMRSRLRLYTAMFMSPKPSVFRE